MDVLDGESLLYGGLIGGLAIAALWDLRTMRIPRFVPNGLVGLWVIVQLGIVVGMGCGGFAQWAIRVMGLVGGAAVIVGALLVVRALLARRRSQTPLGIGDVKLLALVGLYLGIERTLEVVLIASVVALGLAWLLPRVGWSEPPARRPDVAAPTRRSAVGVTARRPDAAVPARRSGAAVPARSSGVATGEGPAVLSAVPFAPGIAVGVVIVSLL